MLFFRSEERVQEWCAAHAYPMRPLVTMDQLWTLATTWYSTRLQDNSRRPQPDEMRSIFARLGLEGDLGPAVGYFRLTDSLMLNDAGDSIACSERVRGPRDRRTQAFVR